MFRIMRQKNVNQKIHFHKLKNDLEGLSGIDMVYLLINITFRKS